MGWGQLIIAVILFIIELFKRKWENDAKKEKRYAELEKKIWEAIKTKDTAGYLNARREFLELRKQV